MHIPERLYDQIRRTMPIPCVDLVVRDASGRILLVRRGQDPCRGSWWFPGGRVLFGETRAAAAARKLKEECNLDAAALEEVATYDLLLEQPAIGWPSHAITTVFDVSIAQGGELRLDPHSLEAAWRPPAEWRLVGVHDFVLRYLEPRGAS